MPEEVKEEVKDTTLIADAKPEVKAEAPAGKTGEEAKPDPVKVEGKVDGQEQKKDEPAKVGAPEKYADFTMPEGVKLDTAANDVFVGVAKELNLSQEQAQKMVDLKVKLDQGVAKSVEAQHKSLVEGWKAESLKALGADSSASLAIAAKARDKFGSPEFVQFMNDTGLGNHPAFIDFCLKVGKAVSEDGLIEGKGGTHRDLSLDERLHPECVK